MMTIRTKRIRPKMINRSEGIAGDREFVDAYFDHFREHGAEALERVRTDNPDVYLEILDELSLCKHPAVFAVLRAHLGND